MLRHQAVVGRLAGCCFPHSSRVLSSVTATPSPSHSAASPVSDSCDPFDNDVSNPRMASSSSSSSPSSAAEDLDIGTTTFSRLLISPIFSSQHEEAKSTMSDIRKALDLRERYQSLSGAPHSYMVGDTVPPPPTIEELTAKKDAYTIHRYNGVFRVTGDPALEDSMSRLPSASDYHEDLMWLWSVAKNPANGQRSRRRLELMQQQYDFYRRSNSSLEFELSRQAGTDFWSAIKVDNHIHAASAATNSHMLSFMRRAAQERGDTVVGTAPGSIGNNGNDDVTLSQLLAAKGVDMDSLSVNSLEMRMGDHVFGRFDFFNRSFSPMGDSELRDVFLKTTNANDGTLFADLLREVAHRSSAEANLGRLEAGQPVEREPSHTAAEPRVSVYGRSKAEWAEVARWWKQHSLADLRSFRWLVQFPRLYHLHKAAGSVHSFGEMLINLFEPLFEVTRDPSLCPELHEFLEQLGGLDTVDDESTWDVLHFDHHKHPDTFTESENPVYSQHMYYYWANLASLNQFRKSRGMNTLRFRPHCGEAGASHHLATAFLVADGINHGINLRHSSVMQYLYFLAQVPISVSPLSNHYLYLKLNRSPFPDLFSRGLRVALSTDDPLQFHTTPAPLDEEYAVATTVFDLSGTDLCELASNSVLSSSFPSDVKRLWLGEDCFQNGIAGNDIHRSAVPNVRVVFREETLRRELHYMVRSTGGEAYTHPPGPFQLSDPVCDGTWRSDSSALQALLDPDALPQRPAGYPS